MKTSFAVAFALALCTFSVGCGGRGLRAKHAASGTGPAEFTVVNHGNEPILYLFMTAADAEAMGADKLGQGNPIAVGASFTVSNVVPGDWDVRVEDASQNYKEWTGETFEPGGAYELEVTADGWSTP